MFENSNMWITGKAFEEIKNKSICVFHSNEGTLTNIKNRDEISTEVFVFVDAFDIIYNKELIAPEIIHKNELVRCLRVHIVV